jgi:hypothetical protein
VEFLADLNASGAGCLTPIPCTPAACAALPTITLTFHISNIDYYGDTSRTANIVIPNIAFAYWSGSCGALDYYLVAIPGTDMSFFGYGQVECSAGGLWTCYLDGELSIHGDSGTVLCQIHQKSPTTYASPFSHFTGFTPTVTPSCTPTITCDGTTP